jgi:hypothetical protein
MDAPVYIFFDKRAKLLPDAERFALPILSHGPGEAVQPEKG